jgi:hypothetical protein
MDVSSSIFAPYWNSGIAHCSSCQWTISVSISSMCPGSPKPGSASVLTQGHQLLDMLAKWPFYAKMFADAGFPLTADQTIPDALVDSLVVSGNEAKVTTRLTELLAAGLDELMVILVPVIDADDELRRLMHLIGRL